MSIAIAEIEGRKAFDAGKSRAENPYPPERAMHDAWLFGWHEGERSRPGERENSHRPDRSGDRSSVEK